MVAVDTPNTHRPSLHPIRYTDPYPCPSPGLGELAHEKYKSPDYLYDPTYRQTIGSKCKWPKPKGIQ